MIRHMTSRLHRRWNDSSNPLRIKGPEGSERLDNQTAAQFWLEPRAFRWHDFPGVGDGHELIHGGRVHGKSASGPTAINGPFEGRRAADAADEVDAFAGPRVFDVEERIEQA